MHTCWSLFYEDTVFHRVSVVLTLGLPLFRSKNNEISRVSVQLEKVRGPLAIYLLNGLIEGLDGFKVTC